jgi:hypothetical protein
MVELSRPRPQDECRLERFVRHRYGHCPTVSDRLLVALLDSGFDVGEVLVDCLAQSLLGHPTS